MDDESTVNESGAAGAGTPPPDGAYSPPQGEASPPYGYAPPGQGYAPPGQDYAPPGQGYAPPGRGYAPPYQQPWGMQPPPPPGYPPIPAGVDPGFKDKKLAAGICGILLGSFGIHKFILGYKNEGLIMLLVTVLTFGMGSIVMSPIGIVEGIMYLTKSDYDFVMTYGVRHKGWF